MKQIVNFFLVSILVIIGYYFVCFGASLFFGCSYKTIAHFPLTAVIGCFVWLAHVMAVIGSPANKDLWLWEQS